MFALICYAHLETSYFLEGFIVTIYHIVWQYHQWGMHGVEWVLNKTLSLFKWNIYFGNYLTIGRSVYSPTPLLRYTLCKEQKTNIRFDIMATLNVFFNKAIVIFFIADSLKSVFQFSQYKQVTMQKVYIFISGFWNLRHNFSAALNLLWSEL